MFRHPVVNFCFFLAFSFSLIFTFNGVGLALHGAGFILIFLLNWPKRWALFQRLKPYLLFLPFMMGIYIVFSIGFSERTVMETLQDAAFGTLKLFVLIGMMSLFFISTPNEDFIKMLRSMWFKMGIGWRWVDDFFLFLMVTLRFYPSFQSNWKMIQSSRKALGLELSGRRIEKAKTAAEDLPRVLLYNLRRSEQISAAMYLRGYGRHFPRPVLSPMAFTFHDGIKIIAILVFFLGLGMYAPF